MSFLGKLFGKEEKESLDQGLQKTKEGFFAKITKAIAGKSTVDEEVLDNLEEALVSADVGIETTIRIIEQIEKRVKEDKYVTPTNSIRSCRKRLKPCLWMQPNNPTKTLVSPKGKNLM
jgi:fused signal recognition particle receptor